MKVLYLDHAGVLGGAELFLLELAKGYGGGGEVLLFSDGPFRERLERDGVTVRILATPASVTRVARGGGVMAQARAVPGVLRIAWRVARMAGDFDVLFANSQKALVIGAVASVLSSKRLVWYLHDILTASHFSRINRKVSVFLGNYFAARVITNSLASQVAFAAAGGRVKKACVVFNGIASADYADEAGDHREAVRQALGLKGVPVVGVFSRLAPWKGQHVLLEALVRLPGVHAMLVGAPLFGDEVRYEEELRAMARSLGIAGRVHLLGFREDIPALLQAIDVVAHTSIAPEPFGRVIVEGMLAGRPVVATRAGGACEIIEDGVTGRLVAPGDVTELVAALEELMANPGEAKRLGEAGRASARDRFSVEAMLAGIEREIGLALGGR